MNAGLLLAALFNGAWQGVVLCALAFFAFRFFRRPNATTMFTVWSALLTIVVVLPVLNYTFAPKPFVVHVVSPMPHALQAMPANHALPPAATAANIALTHMPLPGPAATSPFARGREWTSAALRAVFRYAWLILLVLSAAALARVAVLVRDIIRMLVARGRVRPIDPPLALAGRISRPFRFAASDDFSSPCVLGFSPALIVLPNALLSGKEGELTSVVLHEREHVRRFDDVQNVFQRFIGAIGFFSPGVRIALSELALYREQICDDAAINATGDRISYAMTLTGLAQWAQGRGAPVPNLLFKRKHLLHRLEVLLDSAASHSMTTNRRFAAVAATSLLVASLVVLRVQVPVIAEATVTPTALFHHMQYAHRTHYVHHSKSPAPHKRVVARNAAPALHRAPTIKRVAVRYAIHRKTVTRHRMVAQIAPRARYEAIATGTAQVAYAYTYRDTDTTSTSAMQAHVGANDSNNTDLVNALQATGMRHVPPSELIALRDHRVTHDLILAAASYYGHVTAHDLTVLADRGVGPSYIGMLSLTGLTGVSPYDTAQMMDHGVSLSLIRAALNYFQPRRPESDDFIYMADHGVGAPFIDSLRENGVVVTCWQDVTRLLNHGVTASYAARIRRMNPRAAVSEIIRLHDSGF